MNNLGYPKRTFKQSRGQKGEAYIDFLISNTFDWIYRPVHQEMDFGIDGYIDIVNNTQVTGLSIGVQIKSGSSYIAKRTSGGIKYEGNNKHLNFYLNHKIPVILIVVDNDRNNAFWVEFDIEKTTPTSSGWWIEIPEENTISTNTKAIWENIAGIPEDFSDKVQKTWMESKLIQNSDLLIFSIPKEDVNNGSMDTVLNIIKRLSKNKKMLLDKRSSVEIFFPDYNDDERELYDIPEIRQWFQNSMDQNIPWFYFLNGKNITIGLSLLFICCVNIKRVKIVNNIHKLEPNREDIEEWMNQNFINLNIFTNQNNIDLETNKEVSNTMSEAFMKMFKNT